LAIGGVDFTELKFVIQDEVPAVMEGDAEVSAAVSEVAIYWGKFVNHIFTFIIVAFVIFMIVRAYNKSKKEEEEAPAPDPGPSELDILKEIRDNLKK
jgi:large conductance mechanosensitive channel